MPEDLNLGRQRPNPASRQSGTRTRNRRITGPTSWPRGHAALVKQVYFVNLSCSKVCLACGKDGQGILIFLLYFVRLHRFIVVTWLLHVLASEDYHSKNLQGSWKALNIFSYLSLLNRLLKTSWPSRQPPPLFLWNFALFLKNSSEPPGRPIWNFPDPPVNVPGKLNSLCLIIP